LLEHTVQDGRLTSAGKPHVISQRLQFAAINKAGQAVNAGIAPHLNLRPATAEEADFVRDLLSEDRLNGRSDVAEPLPDSARERSVMHSKAGHSMIPRCPSTRSAKGQ
jgi:hypothetical protein